MSKKLPELFKAEFNRPVYNNQTIYYVSRNNEQIDSDFKQNNSDIDEILHDVFSGIGYSFNIPLIIKTKDKTYDTSLIFRGSNHIMTLDNDYIPISSIISIKRKNPTE